MLVGAGETVEAVHLVERVDHDSPDADLERRRQFSVALGVAVEHQFVRRNPGGERHVHLAAAGDVEQHPFLVGEPGHGDAVERLGRINGAPR